MSEFRLRAVWFAPKYRAPAMSQYWPSSPKFVWRLRVSWRSPLKSGRTRRNKAKANSAQPRAPASVGDGQSYHKKWMNLDDYKMVLYRNQPAGWVAEIPAIPGCYALMDERR